MSRPGRRTTWVGLCAVAAAAGLAGIVGSAVGAGAAHAVLPTGASHPALRTIDAPVLPGTALDRRMKAAQAERAMHRDHHHHDFGVWQANPDAAATWADFSKLEGVEWSIQHQDITVEVWVEGGVPRIAGEATVTVRAEVEGITELAFRSEPLEGVDVQAVDGVALTWGYDNAFGGQAGRLLLERAEPLPVGQNVDFRMAWQAKLDCDDGSSLLKPCSFGNTFQAVMFFRYFVQRWDTLHSPFTSVLHVLTPPDRAAAAPGIPTGPQSVPDGRIVWHFTQNERTSNAGFSIAPYDLTGDGLGAEAVKDKHALRVYTVGNFKSRADGFLELVEDAVATYGDWYGAFPWPQLNVIQTFDGLGGGYAPLGGVFMLRDIFGAQPGGQGWRGAVELTAHEVAHQWWGNLARPWTNGDVALSESMAEFTSCLYTEKRLSSRSQLLGNNLSYAWTVDADHDRPVGANNVYSSPAYVKIVYHKGAVVLDMLRHQIGEESLLAGIANYASAFDRDYATISDLRLAIEEVVGEPLGWFFDQWFERKGMIRAELSASVTPLPESGGARWALRVAQLSEQPFRFKLPVRFEFASGEPMSMDLEVLPPDDGFVSVVSVDLPAAPIRARVDGTRVLLRRFTGLNPGDVNLDGLVDGADLVELAFRNGRAIAVDYGGGQYFVPNAGYDELYDVDANLRILPDDADRIIEFAGASSPIFDAP